MKTDNNHDYFTKVHCVRDLKIIIIIIIIVFTISQFGMFSTYIVAGIAKKVKINVCLIVTEMTKVRGSQCGDGFYY